MQKMESPRNRHAMTSERRDYQGRPARININSL